MQLCKMLTLSFRDSSIAQSERKEQRRRHRPRQLDLSSCQLRRSSIQLLLSDACSPFRTPAVAQARRDDPFLRIIRPDETSSVDAPQLSKLVQSLEAQIGPLPQPWAIRLSSDRRLYFVNSQSGETTWVDPRLSSAGVASSPTPTMDVTFRYRDPSELTPISPRSTPIRVRMSQWIDEERSKVRARNAKINVLRSRVRMAKIQRYTQPLAF